MAVEDIPWIQKGMQQSRLDLAKKVLHQWIRNIPWEHSIISYAREATIESPFTQEKEYLDSIIENLRYIEYYGWSDIPNALHSIRTLYGSTLADMRVIVISDGGMSSSQEESPNITEGLNLFFIGIGSPSWGKIPLGYDANGERRYKYYSWEHIIIPYEATFLEKIADQYDAPLIHMSQEYPFPEGLLISENNKMIEYIFLFLWSFFIIFGYFFHPYVRHQ